MDTQATNKTFKYSPYFTQTIKAFEDEGFKQNS